MNKKFFSIIISLLLLITSFSLVGCGGTKDYNADIQVVSPEDITAEHFVAEEGKTYYTSPGFILSISVKGHFMLMDYFSLEGDKRVYDNLYLYEYDYFYIVTSDYKDLYASLENEDDKAKLLELYDKFRFKLVAGTLVKTFKCNLKCLGGTPWLRSEP